MKRNKKIFLTRFLSSLMLVFMGLGAMSFTSPKKTNELEHEELKVSNISNKGINYFKDLIKREGNDETVVTVEDILPEELLASSSNKWDNSNGRTIAYVYSGKLWLHENSNPTSFINDLLITAPLTKTGDNYTITVAGRTYTFAMEDDELVSITVTSAASDYFDGTYKGPHIHGKWVVNCNENTLTIVCGKSGCSETPISATLTLTAEDEVFSIDAIYKYRSASVVWSDTTLGLPQPTIKYYLVTNDDLVLTTNRNSGATKGEDGSAPHWAGNYVAKATVTIEETSYTVEDAFSITKAEIAQASFADKVEQPVATKAAKSSAFIFPTQTMYNGQITWSPALLSGNKFDYGTAYTATVTLTANSNHTFKDGALETTYVVDGWTKSNNSDDTKLVYTKTFEKTEKGPQVVTITNDISKTYDGLKVSAPTYTKLGEGATVVEYKLASEDDTKYTTTAPTNVGSYIVRVSVRESDTHFNGFNTAEFTITQATFTTVSFTDISTLKANQTAPTSVDGISSDAKYAATITFSPDLVDGKFNFDTIYTATITLTLKDSVKGNGVFATDVVVPNGWTKSSNSTEDTLILTKVFEKTGHNLTKVNGSEPTCVKDGYKDAYYCEECGKYFEDETCTKLIGDSNAYNTWKLNEGLLPRSLSTGALVAICIGSILLVLIIIYLIGYFFLYRKGKLDDRNIKVIYKILPRGEKNIKEEE